MAQGDFIKMGVAVQVKNHSLRHGTRKRTTLSANYTVGTTLTVNSTTPALTNLFKSGDRILVGPSTNTTDSGRRETVRITAVTATTFTLANALTYDYQSGDDVAGVGTQLAEGWTLGGTATASGMDGGGKDDDYAQKVALQNIGTNYLEQTGLAILETNVLYRAGAFWRSAAGTAGDTVLIKVWDGFSYFITSAAIGLNAKTAFTEVTATGTTNATWQNLSAAQYRFERSAGNPADLEIDLVYLEHANGTSTASAGVYTFSEYPDLGVRWSREPQWRTMRLQNETMKRYASSGEGQKTPKHVVEMRFSWAAQAFWDDLMILKKWQDKGNLLALHPNIDDLPPVLVGVMSLPEEGQVEKAHWDLSKRTFALTFVEA